MGRSMPQIELAQDIREEVGLAQAVEEAVVRVAPAERPNASDAETSAVIQQVLSELDGAATAEGRATIASGTQPLPRHRLPIVFLDAIEVTQEVQDLDHSVPLIESKPTIVRAYLRYASGPIQVRGDCGSRGRRWGRGRQFLPLLLGSSTRPGPVDRSASSVHAAPTSTTVSTSAYRTTSLPLGRFGFGWGRSGARRARQCPRWRGCRCARSPSSRRCHCACGWFGSGTQWARHPLPMSPARPT